MRAHRPEPLLAFPSSGDVILVQGAGWVSGAIRRMTRERGEPPTIYSHVAIVIAPPLVGKGVWSTTIVEALAKGVVVRDLAAYRRKHFVVWRNRDPAVAGRAAQYALMREGERYGYTKLALHLLDWALLRNRWRVFRRLGFVDRWPICSYLVADAYRAAGQPFPVPVKACTPDDIADHIHASGDWWRVIP